MHVIAQCFAVGLGFAAGLAGIAFVGVVISAPKETKRHAELMALHHRTEGRLAEYTRYMGVLAEAARWWLAEQKEPKP